MRLTAPLLAVVLSACAARPAAPLASLRATRARHASLRATRARHASPPSIAPGLVRSLSDEVGPRLAGSPGDARAVAWALRTMRSLGFANVHPEPVRVPHWERGVGVGEVTAPFAQSVALAALGGSIATPPDGVEAPVVEVDSLEAIDALAESAVRGRIVYVHRVMRRTRDGSGYGEAVSARTRSAIAAARKGAVAVLVRSIGTDASRAPHTGAMRYDDAVARIPAAALSTADGDTLHRLLGAATREAPVRFRLTLGCRTLPDADSANVVGEVTGSALPREVILLGAHLDSWDLGTGALDDGAGVAIVLAAAQRVMTARPPRRTVRVVLFASEEVGIPGARAYAEAHREELPRHVAAIEADAGDGRVYGITYAGDPTHRAAFHRVAQALSPLGVRERDEPAHGGADLSPLIPAGVPRVDLAQDMRRYFDHHHTANDTPAVLDERSINQAVDAWATAVGELASMEETLGRAAVPSAP